MTRLAAPALVVAAAIITSASVAQSTTAPESRGVDAPWPEQCLVHRGCGSELRGKRTPAPRPIEPCKAKRPAAVPVREALAHAIAGETVRIIGTVERFPWTLTTAVRCVRRPCCNRTSAKLGVRSPGSSGNPHTDAGAWLVLPEECWGDDSAVCCDYELGKPVEITGTWKRVLQAEPGDPVWQLDPVSVCAPT